jgi:uncharacterized membrane protein YukC
MEDLLFKIWDMFIDPRNKYRVLNWISLGVILVSVVAVLIKIM